MKYQKYLLKSNEWKRNISHLERLKKTENMTLNDTELRPDIAVKAIKINGFNSNTERQSYQIVP